jgi:tetratricopeptide (TPR) repeat protein
VGGYIHPVRSLPLTFTPRPTDLPEMTTPAANPTATQAEAAPAERVVCIACREPIAVGARLCPHCGSSQSPWRRLGATLKWIAGGVTVLSLLVGIQNLNGLYRDHLAREAAVDELVAGAERLAAVGDFRRAWKMYEQALAQGPASARVRQGQIELAMRWLPRAHIVGDEKFSDIVDTTLPALTRGLATARGTRAADLLALLGWAHYLQRKDRGISDVDIPGLYAEALKEGPDSVYAHTFLGHWQISEERDLEGGLAHFEKALATERQAEFVRRYQWSSLRNLWFATSSGSEEQIAGQRAALRMANDMRRHGEPLLGERQRSDLLRCYGERFAGESLEDMLPALPREEHLALVQWLLDGTDPDQPLTRASRFVVGRLQEIQGDVTAALATFRALDPIVNGNWNLREPLDEALERLTGVKTRWARERENPLAFHAEILRTSDPSEPRFATSLDYIDNIVDAALDRADMERTGWAIATLEGVQARLAESVPQVAPQDASAPPVAEAVSDAYRKVRDLLGTLYLLTRNLDGAIAEFEGLAADLDPGTWWRRGTLYNLACAYSLRAATHGDAGRAAAMRAADLEHAIEALDRAIAEGYTKWEHIKRDSDLDALRDHPRYRQLMSGR